MDQKGLRQDAADGVSQALALLQADEIDREKLIFLLRGLQEKLIATGEHLQQASDGTQCGSDRAEHVGCAIQKVFGVPELLELILLNFTVIDLLNLQQVNRQIRDAVNTSKKMQLTDPPVRRLDVTCYCSCVRGSPFFNTAFGATSGLIINEKDGITLGRLRDAFQQAAQEHKNCTHAQPQYHDRSGNVILEYTAVGDLYMDRDDPLALVLRDVEYRAWVKWRKMAEYCQAKQQASSLKKKIPTLAEFKAARACEARSDKP
ncbi:hypothetical protein KC332_g5006 [Hortaea werneckii]|nr:hypothetical protein KC358_g3743 [Hortaea werneckii]KAI6846605.1 hypothetical protein KC350_g3843 [Hortaea werneckii]KAI6940333.1 hypothetical protein KC341_g3606 [Hortaea werneckii]KAI6944503.1 hypothetical protein KC348_g3957 [Hortaea werneckii]KAI6968711.1 hypothetical protein KC321_g8305 [Hortaea werneckii]